MDDEFENVSSQLLKRTQAMLDKYRHLLFEESRVWEYADLITLLIPSINCLAFDNGLVFPVMF